MAKITQELKNTMVNEFIDTFNTSDYYLAAAKVQPFIETTIPTPTSSVQGMLYDTYDQLIFGKYVSPSDVTLMIRHIPWVEGNSYTPYSHLVEDLCDTDYYVVSDQDDGTYGVFKCIHKPPFVNALVSDKPLVSEISPEDEMYTTSDGYSWKFMYSISSVDYNKWATENYVPVIANTEVVANAVSGSIDSIEVWDTGALYNSYSSGRVLEAEYNGDPTKILVTSEEYFEVNTYDLISVVGTFETGPVTINVGADTANGIIYISDTNYISVIIDDETSGITATTLQTSNVSIETANASASVINIRRENLPRLSTFDDFYNLNAMYIRSGPGAGELRQIVDYEVNGGEYILTVNTAFTTTPSPASYFYIRPYIEIIGDGTNAEALPKIDTTANTIIDVEIINRGEGYTFANVGVYGNTGVLSANGDLVAPTSASLVGIISPPGGHGSNPGVELCATSVGISVSFITTDHPTEYPYSKFVLIKDPKFDNVELEFSTYGSEFSVGEVLIQDDTNATGTISDIDGGNDIITLTDVSGIFVSSNTVTGQTSNTSLTPIGINKDMTTFSNVIQTNMIVTSGSFEVGDFVANNGSEGYIAGVANSGTELSILDRLGTFEVTNVLTGSVSGAIGTITSITESDIIDNSGSVMYVENSEEIIRTASTTEKLKLIIDI